MFGRRHHSDPWALTTLSPRTQRHGRGTLRRPRLRAQGEYGTIPVRLTAGRRHQRHAGQIRRPRFAIDALEYRWGPYAWERVGYVLTDGAPKFRNIAYPRFMMEQSNFANGDLFAHELGHHWWGDLVAPTIHNRG